MAMELTAETYRSILASLRSDPRSNKSTEKREAPRVGLRSKITVVPDGGKSVSTWCRDLSINGIGLVHGRPMKLGSQFVAMLPTRGKDPMPVVYTVVNCRAISDSLFSIGASLDRIIETTSEEKPAEAKTQSA
jgi:hypothetical protein